MPNPSELQRQLEDNPGLAGEWDSGLGVGGHSPSPTRVIDFSDHYAKDVEIDINLLVEDQVLICLVENPGSGYSWRTSQETINSALGPDQLKLREIVSPRQLVSDPVHGQLLLRRFLLQVRNEESHGSLLMQLSKRDKSDQVAAKCLVKVNLVN